MSKIVKYHDIELDGIHHWDAPKYCDAFISSATVELEDGSFRDATDSELDELNQDGDFVHEQVYKYLY